MSTDLANLAQRTGCEDLIETVMTRWTPEERAKAREELAIAEHARALNPDVIGGIARQTDDATAGMAVHEQMVALAPADEIERMLVNQMIAMNGLALNATARAHKTDQQAHYRDYHNAANKASRTFAVLVEALSRHRGKTSEQKVTVEHVHVHAGGQAVVGAVEVTGGRGTRQKRAEQRHG